MTNLLGFRTTGKVDDKVSGGGTPSGPAGGVLSGTYPDPGFAVDMATQAELDAHINDTADAHDASAISNVPAGTIVATDVQGALNELDTEKIPIAIVDVKGDLIAATAADTVARLPVGGDAQVLTADSAETTGLKWTTLSSANAQTPNPFINSAMQFWQRGTSFPAIASGSYMADRFLYVAVGAMVYTASQSTNVPTVAEADALIPYSLLLDCTTVDSSIAASDFCIVQHLIEGHFASALLQRQFTLSFWVIGTKTGIHCVSFRNQISDRSYVAEYTINTTNTWEYKTITVSASPTAGTWNYTTGMGLSITWALACGSTYQTTAGTWQTGNFIATSNQVNATDSTANDFRITGIKIEPGATATPFVLPDYQQELARCQRYFHKSYNVAVAPGTVSDVGCIAYVAGGTPGEYGPNVTYPVRMRATPTATVYSTATGTSGKKYNASDAVDENMTGYNVTGEQGHSGSNVAHVANKVYRYHFTANADF